MHRHAATRGVVLSAVAAIACLGACAALAQAKPKATSIERTSGGVVNVMSRNVYLGADLSPAIRAKSTQEFIEANGGIVRQVEATNFPVRAKGLAEEILEKKPDLVGLQEVALWREAEPSLGPVLTGMPAATRVKYDFLALLLAQLNKGGSHYRTVIVQPEFDFEAPANANGQPKDGPGNGAPGELQNAEVNGRLTMRDVILARVGAGVKTSRPESDNFAHLLVEKVSGIDVTINRGWTAVNATVRGSTPFRFVNTHLESFDNREIVPSIRAQQAAELVAPGGPATGKLPVILVGDLNSDVPTETAPGDGQAYRVLLGAGLRERSTYKPLGCCISESHFDLKSGTIAEFDHKVDHVMTNAPKAIKLISSSVTGRKMKRGYWDSDHNGLFSSLRLLP